MQTETEECKKQNRWAGLKPEWAAEYLTEQLVRKLAHFGEYTHFCPVISSRR